MRIRKTRQLKDVIIDLIALVRQPASGLQFAVVKSVEGGDRSVDKFYELLKEICGDELVEKSARTNIPKDVAAKLVVALEALKVTIKDQPEEVQNAIKMLARAAGHNFEDSEEKKKDIKTEADPDVAAIAPVLAELQEQVEGAGKQMETAAKETSDMVATVQKSLSALSDRIKTIEDTSGETMSKSADEIKKSSDKTEPDLYVDVIPDVIMA